MRWFKKSSATAEAASDKAGGDVRISAVIAPGAVKLSMEARDKEEAFEEMIDLLVKTGGIKDRDAAVDALRKREALGATGIGNEVALPHGKHMSIPQLVGALGIARNGIDFGSPDGKPAKIIIVLLARTDNPGPHIQALAQIAQLVQSPTFLAGVIEAKTAQEVIELIRAEE